MRSIYSCSTCSSFPLFYGVLHSTPFSVSHPYMSSAGASAAAAADAAWHPAAPAPASAMAMQRLSGRRRLVPPPPRTDEERALLSTALAEGDNSDAAGPSTGDGGVIEIQQLLQSLEAHQNIPYDQFQRAAARLFALSSARMTALRSPFLVASLLRTLVPLLHLLASSSQSKPEAYQSLAGLLVNLYLHGSERSNTSAHPSSGGAASAFLSSTPFRCDDDALCSVLSFLPASDWFAAIRCSRQLYALLTRASAWPARPLVLLSFVGRTLSNLVYTCSASLQLVLVSLFVKATAFVSAADPESAALQPRAASLHAVRRLLQVPDLHQFAMMLLMQPGQPVSALALRFLNQTVAVSDEMAERICVSPLRNSCHIRCTTTMRYGTGSQAACPSFVPVLLDVWLPACLLLSLCCCCCCCCLFVAVLLVFAAVGASVVVSHSARSTGSLFPDGQLGDAAWPSGSNRGAAHGDNGGLSACSW
jgi:hypothetical protein